MPVYKRKNTSGKAVWFYKFQPPGSTRDASPIREFGFATKQEAVDAEVARRGDEQKKLELREAGAAGVAAALPTTLAMLLAEFMKQHAEEKLSPTTVEGYYTNIKYLAPELLAMNMKEITPLHLSREWARLVKCGGHSRKTKEPRAMKPKSVRNIAGMVSSANPVTHSDLPRVKKRIGLALLPAEQDRLIQHAQGPWCIAAFLETCSSLGAGTKTDEPRKVEMPPSLPALLEAHRLRQDKFRRQFGASYRSDLDLIFANPDGTPLMPNSVSSTVARLCRKLGLPKGASLHVLRHSHASLLLADGVDLATIAARLGHSSVRTTADIYSHAIRGKDHAAALSWDDIMQRARSEKPKAVN
jgi:site-specific recombinase XerD